MLEYKLGIVFIKYVNFIVLEDFDVCSEGSVLWDIQFEKSWLYVLVMSHTRFRVNPHFIVAWMSKNSLLEAGAKSEGEVTGTGHEFRTT